MKYRIVWSSPMMTGVEIWLTALASGTPIFEIWVDGEVVEGSFTSFSGAIAEAEAIVRKTIGEGFYKTRWGLTSLA